MEQSENNLLKKIGSVFCSRIKVGICDALSDGAKGFAEMIQLLNTTDGNLNYHLLTMKIEGVIVKLPDGKYELTGLGRIINKVKQLSKELIKKNF